MIHQLVEWCLFQMQKDFVAKRGWTTDEELLDMETEARQRFAGISFAREGDILVMNNS